MWLINTSTLKLELFTGPETALPYAILSHTWEEGEVSFQDFQGGQAASKRGYFKIAKTCELARATEPEPLQYAWVDTCCIDKSSSAELSESINSMYRWYRQSKICYVFLSDWDAALDWGDLDPLSPFPGAKTLRWFTRGWTLQELVAPIRVDFYDQTWTFRGRKSDWWVLKALERITKIDRSILQNGTTSNLRKICLGRRMSWAAHRQTTRIEDVAYCLLGIFQVNMPMLYGEGERAFIRLQEEIIKYSTDFSLFAWRQDRGDNRKRRGILSCHPQEFRHLNDCSSLTHTLSQVEEEEAVITNKGLRIQSSSLVEYPPSPSQPDEPPPNGMPDYFIHLGCQSGSTVLYISLLRLGNNVFVRIAPGETYNINMSQCRRLKPQTIYIALDYKQQDDDGMEEFCSSTTFRCRFQPFYQLWGPAKVWYYFKVQESSPGNLLSGTSNTLFVEHQPGGFGTMRVNIARMELAGSAIVSNPRLSDFLLVFHPFARPPPFFVVTGGKAAEVESFTQSLWGCDPTYIEGAFHDYCKSAKLIQEGPFDHREMIPTQLPPVEDVERPNRIHVTILWNGPARRIEFSMHSQVVPAVDTEMT